MQFAYRNREYELINRRQDKEYFNSSNQITVLPSIYRDGIVNWLAFDDLNQFVNAHHEKEFQFNHDETFKQFNEVKWAIIQHYEVCATPLLDLTRSLRVACSFTLEKANPTGILYVFGFPILS